MTVEQFIRHTQSRLLAIYQHGEAVWLMRIILEYLMGWTQVDVVIRAHDEFSPFMVGKVNAIVERLLHYEPIQYILGEARWYGMKLRVTPDTLIPRPETEQLVDEIVTDYGGTSDLRVLDLCTGSGCIAIALARNLPYAVVEAVDISDAALDVARENAVALKAQVGFSCADVLTLPADPDTYDVIVSNPPYITMAEQSSMSPTVTSYEPHSALFVADDEPLLFYKAIARFAIGSLRRGGKLYFEINPLFASRLKEYLEAQGWADVKVWADARKQLRYIRADYAT